MKICPACSREYTDEHHSCPDDGVPLVHLDTSPHARAQDLIGQVVDGRYRVERVVGRGGMGTVYACRHVVVGKQFAMKVLRPGIERSEEVLQRFIREAQAANAVHSRHICEMTDFGQLPNGAFYVVMELLHGMSLTRALREKRLDRGAIRHIFIQIAETLERAHRAGIVHRDLKPDNVVLVDDEGDPYFVKLVDFGIAKIMESKASSLTETGVILGTPYYMSPEQARGESLDHRSDIYALGVMMYRAFTGRLPFVADTAMGVLTRHLTEKPELPSRVAEIDPTLERLILRCLEKKPIDRFQSMTDVRGALSSMSDTPERGAMHMHPTIDERTGGLGAAHRPQSLPRQPEADMNHPTPTRVATPQAKSARARAHAAAERDMPHASRGMPPPMPAPPPPSAAGPPSAPTRVTHPAHLSSGSVAVPADFRAPLISQMSDNHAIGSGSHALASGGHAMISGSHFASTGERYPAAHHPAAGAVSGAYNASGSFSGGSFNGDLPSHLQGEAGTGRAVVSSRISVRPRNAATKKAVLGGIAALAVSALAIGAIAVLSRSPTASGADQTPAASSAPTSAASADETSTETSAAPDDDATPADSAAAVDSAAPADGASPTASASASPSAAPIAKPTGVATPRPPQPPKPAPSETEDDDEDIKPMPEIRSPFD